MESNKRPWADSQGPTDISGGQTRRSRFGDAVKQEDTPVMLDPVALAAEKAREISRQLAARIGSSIASNNAISSSSSTGISIDNLKASVSSLLARTDKKLASRPLILDEHGNEVDEMGNIVKVEPVRSVMVNQAPKKKINPYLSSGHAEEDDSFMDYKKSMQKRDFRGRKALKFVEAGSYIEQSDALKLKEERKIIAGYSSGRKAPEVIDQIANGSDEKDTDHSDRTGLEAPVEVTVVVPPPSDGGVVPSMEWWDVPFLPKDIRENRKMSKATAEQDHFDWLSPMNCRTLDLIQHPIPIKQLGGELPDQPLPVYLTKKERKRIRKTQRAEREQEKRDKMMVGLIAAPEPKFKLSNFMKILGDQAVSDPSKIERKVVEQMQKRVLNHEMRNLAGKLTPQERKDKKLRKLQEDTSRQVSIAVFRVANLSHPKHRFKIDVNAQQHFLSGLVLMSQEAKDWQLVIVEGGPRGIRKFIRLLTERINWREKADMSKLRKKEGMDDHSNEMMDHEQHGSNYNEDGNEEQSESDDDEDDDEDDDDDAQQEDQQNCMHSSTDRRHQAGSGGRDCYLVWNGVLAKRSFSGFRFQECRNVIVGRKFLESKGLAHYWDMANQIESIVDADVFKN